MANIIKAMKLDFDLVKVYVKAICFTLLIPVVFAIINRSLMTSVSFATCFIAMASGYTFSISEKNGMERLYGILPITKKRICFREISVYNYYGWNCSSIFLYCSSNSIIHIRR